MRRVARMWHGAGLLAVALQFGATGDAIAETRAIVIGIDDYKSVPRLKGATNDARDIASALQSVGVTDLTLLLDAAATRAAITATWTETLARSATGDQIILTYAGHGSQEPERQPGSEADGKDEVLLLAGFSTTGPGTRERFIDDEFASWFSAAEAKGVEVIFLADACHSGSLSRSVAAESQATYRVVQAYEIGDDELQLDTNANASATEPDALPTVTFLGASQDNEKVPEVLLADAAGTRQPRGALSYLFARAIQGQADADEDGSLSRGELFRFVRENTRLLSDSRQTPNLLPSDQPDEVALSRVGTDRSSPLDAALTGVRVAIIGARSGDAATDAEKIGSAQRVNLDEGADLLWDPKTERLYSASGDVLGLNAGEDTIGGMIEKYKTVRKLAALARLHVMSSRIRPSDDVHHQGEQLVFQLPEPPYPNLTLFSIAADGTISYLFPLPGEDTAILSDGYRIDLQVSPPYGADHLIAISSTRALPKLVKELGALNDRKDDGRLFDLINRQLANEEYAMAVQGVFTLP